MALALALTIPCDAKFLRDFIQRSFQSAPSTVRVLLRQPTAFQFAKVALHRPRRNAKSASYLLCGVTIEYTPNPFGVFPSAPQRQASAFNSEIKGAPDSAT